MAQNEAEDTARPFATSKTREVSLLAVGSSCRVSMGEGHARVLVAQRPRGQLFGEGVVEGGMEAGRQAAMTVATGKESAPGLG